VVIKSVSVIAAVELC